MFTINKYNKPDKRFKIGFKLLTVLRLIILLSYMYIKVLMTCLAPFLLDVIYIHFSTQKLINQVLKLKIRNCFCLNVLMFGQAIEN